MIRSTLTETHGGKRRWSCSCRFSPLKARLPEGARYVRFSLLKEAESSRAPLPSWTSTTTGIGMNASDISSCLKQCRIAAQRRKLLIDNACEWLKERGAEAARAGFGLFDFPFVVDDYESLPPDLARQNPDYYHRLLKDAGFESEKGWVDYKIEVRPELLERWQNALETRVMRDMRSYRSKMSLIVAAFLNSPKLGRTLSRAHWGFTPLTEDEISLLFEAFQTAGLFDTSVLAYHDGRPVGMLFVVPEVSATAIVNPGRVLKDSEKLNILAIGVRESARGQGVNLAMAAYGYLELVRRGAKYLSYTLVLDDNWPSRRTAEKLGAFVCANYMVYRRNFRQT